MPCVLFALPALTDVARGSELVSRLGFFLGSSARGQGQSVSKSRRRKVGVTVERQL